MRLRETKNYTFLGYIPKKNFNMAGDSHAFEIHVRNSLNLATTRLNLAPTELNFNTNPAGPTCFEIESPNQLIKISIDSVDII